MKDREEVLSKSKLLKTANIYVSEDLSRKTREQRHELSKHMRFVRQTIHEMCSTSIFLRSRGKLLTRSELYDMTSYILTMSHTPLMRLKERSSDSSLLVATGHYHHPGGQIPDRTGQHYDRDGIKCHNFFVQE